MGKNFYSTALKLSLGIDRFISRILDEIFRLLEVRLPGYGQNLSFAVFEMEFTPLSLLFLEHWRLFCVY